ncbi:MAG TPA: hypothetical protein VM452_10685 [Caulifigura sp.]|nr:hypothetical protein [Caulifigura sp.]
MDKSLNLEQAALCVNQALIGAISPNFRAVLLKHNESRYVVTFILQERISEDLDEIMDFETTLEAMIGTGSVFSTEVLVSQSDIVLEPPSGSSICIFRRRE